MHGAAAMMPYKALLVLAIMGFVLPFCLYAAVEDTVRMVRGRF
jgi:hypothetical protein